MGNLFVNIPVPGANGPGAAVDVSGMGKTKSIVCGGVFNATVNLEFSTDLAAAVWSPLATFHQSGNLTIDIAAHWIRANVSSFKSGAANVDVGSSDSGTVFAELPGIGTPVDISAMPLFKTAVIPRGLTGMIEVSEDGVSWAQIFSFQSGSTNGQSRPVVGQFARVAAPGFVGSAWLGAANDNGDSAGCPCLIVGDAFNASFDAVPNTISLLTGNHEVSAVASLPLAASAGNGARCGFSTLNSTGALWHIDPSGGDTIDLGPIVAANLYYELISDGVSKWIVRIIHNG